MIKVGNIIMYLSSPEAEIISRIRKLRKNYSLDYTDGDVIQALFQNGEPYHST